MDYDPSTNPKHVDIVKVTPDKLYWILSFPRDYTFVFYGTIEEAQNLLKHKCQSEGTGTLRLADQSIEADVELVREEILNVRMDRANGIKDLPYLPGKGWV